MTDIEHIKGAIESKDDSLQVILGAILLTQEASRIGHIVIQAKINLKILESIIKTSPSPEIRTLMIDFIINEVMRISRIPDEPPNT